MMKSGQQVGRQQAAMWLNFAMEDRRKMAACAQHDYNGLRGYYNEVRRIDMERARGWREHAAVWEPLP